MNDALQGDIPTVDDLTPHPPQIAELEEQFEDGYSYAPDGCRVDFPATHCEHGRESWASILGMQDEGEEDMRGGDLSEDDPAMLEERPVAVRDVTSELLEG
jgi:hypothetical protein